MSRRADFLQIVQVAVQGLAQATWRERAMLMAEAQAVPEEALPKALGEAALVWMDHAHGGRCRPPWLDEWEEGQKNRVTVERCAGQAALWWTRAFDGERAAPEVCRQAADLVIGSSSCVSMSRAEAEQFRAWVESVPGYEPSDPPFLFREPPQEVP